MQCRQLAGQVLPGGHQAVSPELGQAVEDEHGAGGGVRDPGPDALPPVPAAAGHAVVITPDHLARFGMLHHGLPVAHGVERLVSGRPRQPGRPAVHGEILPADGQQVPDRDRVVDVGEPVDPGQPGLHPAQQRLDAGPGAFRLGAEGLVGEPPGGHRLEVRGDPARQRGPGLGFGVAQQRVGGLVTRTRVQPVGDDDQRGVVRAQIQDGALDRGQVEPAPRPQGRRGWLTRAAWPGRSWCASGSTCGSNGES